MPLTERSTSQAGGVIGSAWTEKNERRKMIPSNWKTILTPQTLLYPRDVPTENFLLSPDVCIVNSATNHIAIINQLIRSLPKLQDRGHRFPFDFGPCALVRSAYPCAKYSSFACSPSQCEAPGCLTTDALPANSIASVLNSEKLHALWSLNRGTSRWMHD